MDKLDKYKLHTYSYLGLRKAIGFIGVALPVVLVVGTNIVGDVNGIGSAISWYYVTSMGDLFVGAMCGVGLFMFFYAGYGPVDNWTGNVAGITALGVALFPAAGDFPAWVRAVHLTSATTFFLTLTFFSIYLFTKTEPGKEPTPRKIKRNRIYVACGVVMLAALLVIALDMLDILSVASKSFVFWGETVALEAFGISWLTKGEAILPDRE